MPRLCNHPLFWLMLVMPAADGARAETPAWSGLSDLRALALEEGHPLRGENKVDLGALRPNDGLLIIGPSGPLPMASLGEFLDAGGRMAVLEDYGQATRLLASYQIQVGQPQSRQSDRVRGNPDLLAAQPATDHPLTQDVDVLLANRPVTLHHSVLNPVFNFVGSEHALVLAGAVGAGRLVAVGDASLLINQHLALPSHGRFAQNLLSYLAASGGELWLVGPEQQLFGTYGRPHRPGLQRVNVAISKLSHPDLPLWVVMALAAAAVAAATVWVVGSLPKVTPYLTPEALPTPRVWAGFAGRIDPAPQDRENALWAALDYRGELYTALAHTLGVHTSPDRRSVLLAAEAAGRPEAQRRALDELLDELDALASAEDGPEELPRVRPEELQRMVTTGERLLDGLEMETG